MIFPAMAMFCFCGVLGHPRGSIVPSRFSIPFPLDWNLFSLNLFRALITSPSLNRNDETNLKDEAQGTCNSFWHDTDTVLECHAINRSKPALQNEIKGLRSPAQNSSSGSPDRESSCSVAAHYCSAQAMLMYSRHYSNASTNVRISLSGSGVYHYRHREHSNEGKLRDPGMFSVGMWCCWAATMQGGARTKNPDQADSVSGGNKTRSGFEHGESSLIWPYQSCAGYPIHEKSRSGPISKVQLEPCIRVIQTASGARQVRLYPTLTNTCQSSTIPDLVSCYKEMGERPSGHLSREEEGQRDVVTFSID